MSKLPKAEFESNSCHCYRLICGPTQLPPYQMQPTCYEILLWAHPKMIVATQRQRPKRNPYGPANFGHIKRLVGPLLDSPMEPPHDQVVTALCCLLHFGNAGVEASYQRLDQHGLQSTRCLRV